jgi:osmotically-inducible protein OsmY
MMLSKSLAAVSLVGALFLAAPARAAVAPQQTGTSGTVVDDDTLESRIETTLKKDTILAPRDIDVEAKSGRVTLTGSVRTADEKARAAKLAMITGVTSVDNRIEIDPNINRSKTDAAVDKTKAGLDKAADATGKAAKKTKEGVEKGVGETEKGAGKAADKTADAMDKAGDKLSDTSVSTKVKSGFSKDPLLKETAIDVHTSNHVVTLKGTVPSAAAKARAEDVAARTEGVARVVNEIVVQDK